MDLIELRISTIPPMKVFEICMFLVWVITSFLHFVFKGTILYTQTHWETRIDPTRVLFASDVFGGRKLGPYCVLSAVSEDLNRSTQFDLYPAFRFIVGLVLKSILVASVISLSNAFWCVSFTVILKSQQKLSLKSPLWCSFTCWTSTLSVSLFIRLLRCSRPLQYEFLELSPK